MPLLKIKTGFEESEGGRITWNVAANFTFLKRDGENESSAKAILEYIHVHII